MKALAVIVGLFGILFAVAYLVLDYTRPIFPVSRVITNSEGKDLDVLIQGKSGETLTIDRVSDGTRYTIPVRSLSFMDRIFVMRLSDQEAPGLPKEPGKPEDPYIERRLASIEELRRKSILYKSEMQSRDRKDTLYNLRKEQLAALEREIKALEMSIETYKYQVLKE